MSVSIKWPQFNGDSTRFASFRMCVWADYVNGSAQIAAILLVKNDDNNNNNNNNQNLHDFLLLSWVNSHLLFTCMCLGINIEHWKGFQTLMRILSLILIYSVGSFPKWISLFYSTLNSMLRAFVCTTYWRSFHLNFTLVYCYNSDKAFELFVSYRPAIYASKYRNVCEKWIFM